MKAYLYVSVICPECKSVMHNNDDGSMQCTSGFCSQFIKKFNRPSIELIPFKPVCPTSKKKYSQD